MEPWHEGLPETTQFVVFPPLGREQQFTASKERIDAHLRAMFPGLEFEMSEFGLYEDPSIIPMCGTVGDDGDSEMRAPPSEQRMREIERELKAFDVSRTGLS